MEPIIAELDDLDDLYDMAEIVYSEEYEDYVCSRCGELMPLTNFRYCPYCGLSFRPRKAGESK